MLRKWDITIPQLSGKRTRRAYIYLPRDYYKDTQKRYSVLYMFDGHNVFLDSDASYGKSWGLGKYLDRTNKDILVVAIECNHEGNRRLSEYTPLSFQDSRFGFVKAQGKQYMEWLTKAMKPIIDNRLRTLPDRNHTLIAGSSMGGLMALYGATVYNQYFSRAACLSPSLWTDPQGLLEMVEGCDLGTDTCIYMDYGTEEIGNHPATIQALGDMAALLYKKRVDLNFRIIPGGTHSEASWERQIPVFMQCLGV